MVNAHCAESPLMHTSPCSTVVSIDEYLCLTTHAKFITASPVLMLVTALAAVKVRASVEA